MPETHKHTISQVRNAAASMTPSLLSLLVRSQPEFRSRVAVYETQLRALPRRVRRALQRQWRLPLAGIALMLALGQSPGLAATISVSAGCTLIDAITAANTDTATGGCPAGSGADTIVLPAGSRQTLTEVNNDTYGPTGLPLIRSVITIEGQGSTMVRDNTAPDFRMIAVHSTGELTLQETTVSGGVVAPGGDPDRDSGGGVANYGGIVTVTNSTISGNVANSGGGVAYSGGGVANLGGTLTVTNSTITGNVANRGGGVANYGGIVTVTDSTISGNAGGTGVAGGVYNDSSGTLTVTNSTISGNSGSGVYTYGIVTVTNSTISGNSGDGVASYSDSGIVTVTNSTISGNAGSGVYNSLSATLTVTDSTISGNAGSGVVNSFIIYRGTVTMTNSTISGNAGNGVVNFDSLTMTNCTISGNFGNGVVNSYGDTLTLVRTLVAGNTAATGPEIVNRGTVLADNHNLFGVDGTAGVEGFRPGPTDIVPPEGVLLSDILQPRPVNNGGPTPTHALVPGSPAIDAGGTVCTDAEGNPLLTDQRGEPRPVDGDGDGQAACDIGAFEVQEKEAQREVIDFEDIPAGTVVTEVFSDGSFGPINVKGSLGKACQHNAAVVFDSSCPTGICSGDDQDLGTPNRTFDGPGEGKGGEVGSPWANDVPLGNLLIAHERCHELADGFVENPDDTGGASTIILEFPQPVRVFSYTIVDNERNEGEQVKLFGVEGERLATLTGPVTGNNGKAVVQTTSNDTGIGGVIRMVFKRHGSRGLDNIVILPEASVSSQKGPISTSRH